MIAKRFPICCEPELEMVVHDSDDDDDDDFSSFG